MSSFLFSASITLALLSILSLSTADLVDTDGDPIINGRDYYIIPESSTTGLTYTRKKNTGRCPLHITKEITNESSPGTPVKISSRDNKTLNISLDEHVNLAFEGRTPCGRSLPWGATADRFDGRFYVTFGGPASIVGPYPFIITKTDNSDKSELPVYELKFANGPRRVNVGLFEDNGLLGTIPDPNTKMSFKKAFSDDVLKLSATA